MTILIGALEGRYARPPGSAAAWAPLRSSAWAAAARPMDVARARRRAASRRRMRRQRLAGAAGALAAFVVVLVVALGSGGSSKHASHRGGAHPTAARRSGQIVPGGPLA